MRSKEKHIEFLITKYTQLHMFGKQLTELGLTISHFDGLVTEIYHFNDDQLNIATEQLTCIAIYQTKPNQTINICIHINLLESRIISVESPHLYIKENDIYDITTYWIGMTSKIRKIKESIDIFKEEDKLFKKKHKFKI